MAAGAVALFAAVWLTNPAKLEIEGILPPLAADARAYIEKFIAVSDKGDPLAAYSSFSDREKSSVSLASYRQLVSNVRTPLGLRIVGPFLWNTSNSEEVPGGKGLLSLMLINLNYQNK
ncbi:hypothetical protein [Zoogloea sp.]|uniref:hypothetical protein n=1 Tax=Zoogloea sp. TaxID=49181 RepID=UPI0035B2CAF3